MKCLRAWLSQFDWGAQIGAALCLVFYLGVAGPVIINWPAHLHSSQQQQAEPAKDSDKELDVPAAQGGDEALATYTLWLVVFTAILAASTIGLWLVTAKTLSHAQDDAARQAKDAETSNAAAIMAAKAAVRIQMPIIRPTFPQNLWVPTRFTDFGIPEGGQNTDKALYNAVYIADFTIANDGATAAYPSRIMIDWILAARLPETPPDCRYALPCKHGEVIREKRANEVRIEARPMVIALTNDQIRQAAEGGVSLWVFGVIYFTDFMEDERIARFCWKWGSEYQAGLFYFHRSPDIPKAYIGVN